MHIKEECCGCMACVNICPRGCIKVEQNKTKNIKVVNHDVCSNCGLCETVCIRSQNVETELNSVKVAYVACGKKHLKNDGSSSGGVARVIYEYCNSNDIYPIGVKWENNVLLYDFVTTDLMWKYVGSKYIQADLTKIYKEIEHYRNKKIVFIGLPCHVYALKRYMKRFKSIDVIYIDLVCHGVPNQNVFMNHIMKKTKNTEIENIRFRDKDNEYGLSLCEGNQLHKYFYWEDAYCSAFLNGISSMNSCYKCKFARRERVGDITLKDYCDIKKYSFTEREFASGLSNILINTKKGEEFFETINSYLKYEIDDFERIVLLDDRVKENMIPRYRKAFVFCCTLFGYENALGIFNTVCNISLIKK